MVMNRQSALETFQNYVDRYDTEDIMSTLHKFYTKTGFFLTCHIGKDLVK